MKKVIVLIILIVILILIGIYYYNKDNSNNTSDNNSNKIVDLSMNKIKKDSCDSLLYGDFFSKSNVLTNDISNELAIEFVTSYYKNTIKKNTYITKEEMNKYIKSILGSNYSFEHKDYKTFNFNLDYNSKDKVYNCDYISNSCDETDNYYGSLERITDYKESNNSLEITYKVLFSDYNEDNITYYRDYYKTDMISEDDLSFEGDGSLMNDSHNLEYASTYKFIFEKENNNYIFVSSELVK